MKILEPALRALLWLPLLVLCACSSTSSAVTSAAPALDLSSPARAAAALAGELDAGRVARAEAQFAASTSQGGAETLYPPLFQLARERYAKGDFAGSTRVTRFMAGAYPDAVAVREALVFGLFLERSEVEEPDPELVRELEAALAGLREHARTPPAWVDLIEAQCAVDRGDLDAGRSALTRFRAAWDEDSDELGVYVDDLERALFSG